MLTKKFEHFLLFPERETIVDTHQLVSVKYLR